MKTFGSGSLAVILKMLLDGAWYLGWAALVLASIILTAAAGTFIMNLLGYSPGNTAMLLETLYEFGLGFSLWIAAFVTAIIVLGRMRRIVATLIAGDPFVPENARHLRVIAISIMVYQLTRHAVQGTVAMILTMMDKPVEGGAQLSVTLDIEWGAWIGVIAFLIFAEIFREGAKMHQEQKLTI